MAGDSSRTCVEIGQILYESAKNRYEPVAIFLPQASLGRLRIDPKLQQVRVYSTDDVNSVGTLVKGTNCEL